MKVKETSQGYEVNLNNYVSKLENIVPNSIHSEYENPTLFDITTGTVLFSKCPEEIFYEYNTHSPNNVYMDITIRVGEIEELEGEIEIVVIERGSSTDKNIIFGIDDNHYRDATYNSLTKVSISKFSKEKYSKKVFVADGNSRLIIRVQTQKTGNITFELEDINSRQYRCNT